VTAWERARYAVRVLAVGTWALVSWAWSKLWAAGRADDDPAGPIILIVVGVGMVYGVLVATPILASPLTLAWLVGAGIAGHKRLAMQGDDAEPESALASVEAAAAPVNAPTDADLIYALGHLIGTRNGVLLRDVVKAFHKAGVRASWGIPELRVQCERLGIPIKESIQVGKSTSKGIHREGLKKVIYPTLAGAEKQPSYWPSDLNPQEEASSG